MQILTLILGIFSAAVVADPIAPYNRANYLPPTPYRDQLVPEGDSSTTAEIRQGISVFRTRPFRLADLPLCLNLTGADVPVREVVEAATLAWNQASQRQLGKAAFSLHCSGDQKPRVEILFTAHSGTAEDDQIKFGEVFYLKTDTPKVLLVLRQPEMTQFEALLADLGRKQVLEKKMEGEQKASFERKFGEFKAKKLKAMALQVVVHELGHVLGLGHNFNSDENSVMNYSDQTELSAYDLDALSFVFKPEQKLSREWHPALKPPGIADNH